MALLIKIIINYLYLVFRLQWDLNSKVSYYIIIFTKKFRSIHIPQSGSCGGRLASTTHRLPFTSLGDPFGHTIVNSASFNDKCWSKCVRPNVVIFAKILNKKSIFGQPSYCFSSSFMIILKKKPNPFNLRIVQKSLIHWPIPAQLLGLKSKHIIGDMF